MLSNSTDFGGYFTSDCRKNRRWLGW